MRDVWELPDPVTELDAAAGPHLDAPPAPGRREVAHGRHPTQKPIALLRRIVEASRRRSTSCSTRSAARDHRRRRGPPRPPLPRHRAGPDLARARPRAAGGRVGGGHASHRRAFRSATFRAPPDVSVRILSGRGRACAGRPGEPKIGTPCSQGPCNFGEHMHPECIDSNFRGNLSRPRSEAMVVAAPAPLRKPLYRRPVESRHRTSAPLSRSPSRSTPSGRRARPRCPPVAVRRLPGNTG